MPCLETLPLLLLLNVVLRRAPTQMVTVLPPPLLLNVALRLTTRHAEAASRAVHEVM